jgi:multidrug efflux pump subunit AcrA (membrane-fusion protein)
VHEVGFLLIYLQPALYCNVTDAWLFPDKSKRLWVTFAGAYLEMVLWAVATLIWRVTERGTGVSHLALVVMATSGIKTLFNLNPLIKLDGYYLLSDALEIPNLRHKAFHYIRGRLRRLWESTPGPVPTLTRRERRIFMTYGVLAGIFSIFLLGLMIMQIGEFLISRYQGIGFVMFTGFLAFVARGPLKRAAKRIPRLFPGGPRGGAWWTGRTKALIFVLSAGAAFFLVRMELTVSGEFKIIPSHLAEVRADVEGIIESIEVDEGARVNPGAVVARLSQRDVVSELRKTEAEIGEREAKLKMLLAGPRAEEIALQRDAVVTARTRVEHARNRQAEAERLRTERRARAETGIEKARERFGYAQRILQMHQSLFAKELIAMKQLIEAQEAAAVRKKELEEAEAELKVVLADDLAESRKAQAVAEKEMIETESKLKILLAGSRREEIDGVRAELARFETQRRYREEEMRLTTITSPIAGIVTTPKLKDKIGQHVKKGDLIAEVQQLRTVTAEISVPEAEIGDVRIGQPVTVKARAYPDRTFSGVVSAIGAAATKSDGQNIVRVTTTIDNPDNLLKAELTGQAKIRSDSRSLGELMTRRIARYIRVEFWSWW